MRASARPSHADQDNLEQASDLLQRRRGSQVRTHPKTYGGAILIELEANEAVDENAPIKGANSASVHCSEPRVNRMVGRNDGGIEEDGEELDKHVDVEEQDDLLASDSGIFGTDVE